MNLKIEFSNGRAPLLLRQLGVCWNKRFSSNRFKLEHHQHERYVPQIDRSRSDVDFYQQRSKFTTRSFWRLPKVQISFIKMSKSASTAENSSSSLLLSPRSTINNNNSLSVVHTTPRVSNNNIQSQASPSVVDSHQNNNENSRTSGISSAWSKPSSSLTNATKKSSGTPQAWRNDQSSESPSINSSNVSSPEVKINPRETFNKNKGNNYSQKNLHSFRVVNVSSTSSNTSSQVKSPKPSSSNTVKKPPSPSIPSATPSQDENSKNSALSSLTSPRGGVDCSQEMKDDLKRYIEELHRECEVNGQDFTMEVVNILSSTCNELSEVSVQ